MLKIALIVLLVGLAVEAVGQPVVAPQCQATMTCGP